MNTNSTEHLPKTKSLIEPFVFPSIRRHSENGLWNRMFDCTDSAAKAACRALKITVFETKEQYINDFSGSPDLVLNNFYFIFLYYFLFCSLIFAAFILHHLAKFISGRTFVRLTLRHYFTEISARLREWAR